MNKQQGRNEPKMKKLNSETKNGKNKEGDLRRGNGDEEEEEEDLDLGYLGGEGKGGGSVDHPGKRWFCCITTMHLHILCILFGWLLKATWFLSFLFGG